jgi:hypothetical protein
MGAAVSAAHGPRGAGRLVRACTTHLVKQDDAAAVLVDGVELGLDGVGSDVHAPPLKQPDALAELGQREPAVIRRVEPVVRHVELRARQRARHGHGARTHGRRRHAHAQHDGATHTHSTDAQGTAHGGTRKTVRARRPTCEIATRVGHGSSGVMLAGDARGWPVTPQSIVAGRRGVGGIRSLRRSRPRVYCAPCQPLWRPGRHA